MFLYVLNYVDLESIVPSMVIPCAAAFTRHKLYVLLLSRMPLMEFQRCGVVGVSSPDERTLGGKSRENRLFRSTGGVVTSEDDEDECLWFVSGADLTLMSPIDALISPSSVTTNRQQKAHKDYLYTIIKEVSSGSVNIVCMYF